MALQPFNDPLCETCLYSFFGSIRDRFRLAHDLRLWFVIFRFRENFLINSNILLSFQIRCPDLTAVLRFYVSDQFASNCGCVSAYHLPIFIRFAVPLHAVYPVILPGQSGEIQKFFSVVSKIRIPGDLHISQIK